MKKNLLNKKQSKICNIIITVIIFAFIALWTVGSVLSLKSSCSPVTAYAATSIEHTLTLPISMTQTKSSTRKLILALSSFNLSWNEETKEVTPYFIGRYGRTNYQGSVDQGLYELNFTGVQAITSTSTSETWLLNETINTSNSVNITSNISCTINLLTNNQGNYVSLSGNTINVSGGAGGPYAINVDSSGNRLIYYDALGGWNSQYNNAYYKIDDTSKLRTIIFATPPIGDLLTWLQANGVKQPSSPSDTLVVSEDYINLKLTSTDKKVIGINENTSRAYLIADSIVSMSAYVHDNYGFVIEIVGSVGTDLVSDFWQFFGLDDYFVLKTVSINSNSSDLVSFNDGYAQGIKDREQYGNQQYLKGKADGIESANTYSFTGLFTAIFDVPIQTLFGLLNVEILGVNLYSFFTGLLTLALIIFVIKLVI